MTCLAASRRRCLCWPPSSPCCSSLGPLHAASWTIPRRTHLFTFCYHSLSAASFVLYVALVTTTMLLPQLSSRRWDATAAAPATTASNASSPVSATTAAAVTMVSPATINGSNQGPASGCSYTLDMIALGEEPLPGACEGPVHRVLERRRALQRYSDCGVGGIPFLRDGNSVVSASTATAPTVLISCGVCLPGSSFVEDGVCMLGQYCSDVGQCAATSSSPLFRQPCPYEVGGHSSVGYCGPGLRCLSGRCTECLAGVDAIPPTLRCNGNGSWEVWDVMAGLQAAERATFSGTSPDGFVYTVTNVSLANANGSDADGADGWVCTPPGVSPLAPLQATVRQGVDMTVRECWSAAATAIVISTCAAAAAVFAAVVITRRCGPAGDCCCCRSSPHPRRGRSGHRQPESDRGSHDRARRTAPVPQLACDAEPTLNGRVGSLVAASQSAGGSLELRTILIAPQSPRAHQQHGAAAPDEGGAPDHVHHQRQRSSSLVPSGHSDACRSQQRDGAIRRAATPPENFGAAAFHIPRGTSSQRLPELAAPPVGPFHSAASPFHTPPRRFSAVSRPHHDAPASPRHDHLAFDQHDTTITSQLEPSSDGGRYMVRTGDARHSSRRGIPPASPRSSSSAAAVGPLPQPLWQSSASSMPCHHGEPDDRRTHRLPSPRGACPPYYSGRDGDAPRQTASRRQSPSAASVPMPLAHRYTHHPVDDDRSSLSGHGSGG